MCIAFTGTTCSPHVPLSRRPTRRMASTCSGHWSTRVTSRPARVSMPPTTHPMAPAPMMPIRSIMVVLSLSEISQSVLVPALAHPRLVLGGRAHGGREALALPFGPPLELPRARRVDEHAVPQAGAEPAHLAVGQGRARVDGRAEDAREDHDAVLAGVDPVGEGPVHLLVRRRVDVLLDHRDVLVAVLRGAVAPERGGDLLGLALVGLP